jgi:hypothetical protein
MPSPKSIRSSVLLKLSSFVTFSYIFLVEKITVSILHQFFPRKVATIVQLYVTKRGCKVQNCYINACYPVDNGLDMGPV